MRFSYPQTDKQQNGALFVRFQFVLNLFTMQNPLNSLYFKPNIQNQFAQYFTHFLFEIPRQIDTRTTPRTFLKCAHLSARTINFNIVVKNLYTKTTGASQTEAPLGFSIQGDYCTQAPKLNRCHIQCAVLFLLKHNLLKDEKRPFLAPPRCKNYKAQQAQQGVKITGLMSAFISKKFGRTVQWFGTLF